MKTNLKALDPKICNPKKAVSTLISLEEIGDTKNYCNDTEIYKVQEFNEEVLIKIPQLKKYITIQTLISPSYRKRLNNLLSIDQGGFEHGDLSGLYTTFQNSSRYCETRMCGWNSLLDIAFTNIQKKQELGKGLIIDFLAGSGTLSQKVKQLQPKNCPQVIGLDVSRRMAERAQIYDEIVFWGSHEAHPFKSNIADIAIAAYGFHHVAKEDRINFIRSMYQSLKLGGLCILHDFEENSPTAKWYSDIIHHYRSVGHPYPHFTKTQFVDLLGSYFDDVTTHYVYDPFYLEEKEGQDANALKQEFYAYLICLFNLDKLLPNNVPMISLAKHNDVSYWRKIEEIFLPTFTLAHNKPEVIENKPLHSIKTGRQHTLPIVETITLQELSDGRLCLIAPRIALVGIGVKEK